MNDPNVSTSTTRCPVCVPSLSAEPLPREEAERLARLLKAVADPTRLQLLSLIQASSTGEACVCDLTEPFDLSQPTVSHHLKIMVEAGILHRERRGSWAYYSVNPDGLQDLTAVLHQHVHA